MEATIETLYSELRNTRKELLEKLQDENASTLIRPIIEDELKDILAAIEKIENGTYGRCEISGELIPYEILISLPTAKTLDDFHYLKTFYRKPLTL